MTCQAGLYNRRITFQEQVESRTSTGAIDKAAWSDISITPNMWAKVKDLRGEEYANAGVDQVISNLVTMFTVRYRADITAKMSILYEGNRYDILSKPKERGNRESIEVLAEYNS